jgi:hypothetical protein
MLPQNSNDFSACANRKALTHSPPSFGLPAWPIYVARVPAAPFAHVSATSTTFAPAANLTSEGSNQSANASFALPTASSSLSPAEAQLGSSGKNAAQRFVSGSCSYSQSQFHRGEGTPAAEGQQTLRKSDSFQGGPLSRISSVGNQLFGARVL